MGKNVEGQTRDLLQVFYPNFLDKPFRSENYAWASELRNRSANRWTGTFGRQELLVTCHVVVFDCYEDAGYRLT